MNDTDRRKHTRIGRDTVVSVKVLSFPLEDAETVKVEMDDVSSGGVGLVSPVPFDGGISLEVSLRLPGWFRHTSGMGRFRDELKPLTAVGRVTRCEPLPQGGYGVGVEFTDIWDDHWKAMRQYLGELIEAANMESKQ